MFQRNRHAPRPRWFTVTAAAAVLAGITTAGAAVSTPAADDVGADADDVSTSTVADGRVLYSSTGDGSYPRVIRLDQADSTGNTLLATHFAGRDDEPGRFPIYRSTDAGQTWTELTTITSNTPNSDLGAPVLYEVPRTANGLNAGDLLASGTAYETLSAQKVEVFKSTDQGETWEYLSSCTETSGLPDERGHGIWEPWFLLADDNTLACFISDERPEDGEGDPNNQVIGHYTSTDGGQTWSDDLVLDLAFRPDGSGVDDELARPGMSIITPLPNGEYLMTYEMCRDATHADHACEVYIKTSPDGLDWSPADDPGTLVRTADGRHLLHTPYVAWSPAGGPDGTLLMSGQRVTTGPTGDKAVMPESGKVLLANTQLGEGAWHEITAPMTVDPTGFYVPGAPSCPGYSSPILPSQDGEEILMMAGTLRDPETRACEIRFGFGSLGTLPFTLPLDDVKEGFAEYGGSWQVAGGTLSVTDSVPGSKAVTGSEAWTDYTVSTEVRLDAGGQAGLVTRLSAPGVGPDAHRGYYAGIDSTGNQLIVGRQNDGEWIPLGSTPVSGGVGVGAWYELSVRAEGCDFTVTVQPSDGSAAPSTLNIGDTGCFGNGAVAARSHFTPASWRSIEVTTN